MKSNFSNKRRYYLYAYLYISKAASLRQNKLIHCKLNILKIWLEWVARILLVFVKESRHTLFIRPICTRKPTMFLLIVLQMTILTSTAGRGFSMTIIKNKVHDKKDIKPLVIEIIKTDGGKIRLPLYLIFKDHAKT